MAYWSKKRNKYVFVYEYVDGKPRQFPRSLTKHLDTQPDDAIDHWVKQFSAPTSTPATTPLLDTYKRQYLSFLAESRAPATVTYQEFCLRVLIFPYFLSCTEDINDWPRFSIKFRQNLLDLGRTRTLIRSANSALRGFWKYLVEERLVYSQEEMLLRPPGASQNRTTPLKNTLSPEQVLTFVRASRSPVIRLLALLGYFFSLRPQETFCLLRSDFRANENIEACRAMRAAGLYGKLAVYISKQRRHNGTEVEPKASSKGFVSCFDKRAAELIVGDIRGLDATASLFSYSNDWLGRRWKTEGIPGITLKDLRRASIYYLGHYTQIEYAALKSHARHANPNTTWLYLRRAEETCGGVDDLTL
jgi:integrase